VGHTEIARRTFQDERRPAIDPSFSLTFHLCGEALRAAASLAATLQLRPFPASRHCPRHHRASTGLSTLAPGCLAPLASKAAHPARCLQSKNFNTLIPPRRSGDRPNLYRGEDKTAMLHAQRHNQRVRPQARPLVESLDDRLVLSGGAAGTTAAALVHYQPATDVRSDHVSSPREVPSDGSPATLSLYFSQPLRLLYREYEGPGGHSQVATSPPADGLSISGSRVAVIIKVAYPPALGGYYLTDLRADGLRVFRTVPAEGLAEGTLPIAKLPVITPLVAHVWPYYGAIPSRHASK
jgi:hypothetical protein